MSNFMYESLQSSYSDQSPVTSHQFHSLEYPLSFWAEVATLVNERQQAGFYQVEWDASGFASGVYYYKLETGDFVDVRKMVLLR